MQQSTIFGVCWGWTERDSVQRIHGLWRRGGAKVKNGLQKWYFVAPVSETALTMCHFWSLTKYRFWSLMGGDRTQQRATHQRAVAWGSESQKRSG
jgi:hypothetical protein